MEEERARIEKARAGDQEAFAHLVDAYKVSIYNLAYRMLGNAPEAEEAAQETFLRAYRRLLTYQLDRRFSTWLLSIASHYCIDRLRRRRFSWVSLDELEPWQWPASREPRPEETVLRQEKQDEVWQMLDLLPEQYRAAVILRYWYDLSYQEIAEVTDSTISAVKSRLHRARRMLARKMIAHSEEVGKQLETNTQTNTAGKGG